MFAPRSPGAAGKNKRKRSGSECPSSTADPVVRLSPTRGHENVRALSQPQSMPFLPPSSLQSGSLGLGDDPVSRHSPVDTIANSSGDEPSRGQSMIAKKKKLPKRVEQPKAHGDQPIILAPSGRPYLQFQDGSKSLGILIPDGWKPHSQPGSDRQYPCPKAHRDCLFNDNLDGTIEIISQRRPDGQGRVVVSQVPRPLMSDAGPSLVVSDLGEAESRDVSKDAPNTAEANQQGDKRQVVTTWDAVNSTYDCVPAAFEECPGDATISFLASLPAAEGALAANDKKGPGKVFRIPDYRWGKLYNLKAALVQAHGLHAE
ncbi:hypothetical protein Daus18300_014544 [Diaporthe australafricana]|uniref:Uncharacterized protein n=1 Tax=Diaporthe australafricana TaxID=127596 RepID=A0ABR3VUV1_9PEZI